MADSLDILSSAHATDPVSSDNYLFTLARFGDPDAFIQLWNRYYTTAYLAGLDQATKKNPAALIVTSSFEHWLDHTEKRTHADSFMADWYIGITPERLSPAHRAALWAFYSMSEHNRTCVWHYVDPAVGEEDDVADEQFAYYLSVAAGSLRISLEWEEFDPPNWRGLLVASMLGSSTDVYDELGSRISSADVISPPDCPQLRFSQPSRPVPLNSILRVIAIIVVALALALIGIFGLTRWNRSEADQPPETIPVAVTTPSTSRAPTPTPTLSPSAEVTEETTAAEPETQANPAPARTTSRGRVTQTNPAPEPSYGPTGDSGIVDAGGDAGSSDTGGSGVDSGSGTDTGTETLPGDDSQP